MKPIGYLAAVPKFHGLLTTLVCASLIGGGWHIMSTIHHLERVSESIEEDLRFPSAVYNARQHKLAAPASVPDTIVLPSPRQADGSTIAIPRIGIE